MASFIEVNDLKKSFGDKHVLRGITFSLEKGDIIGLIGMSGCGKSTLLKILVGYYKADSGEIKLDGKIVKDIKRAVGYTTQENSFYDKLSVYENMAYYGNLYGFKPEDKKLHIHEILESVGLWDAKDKLAEDLSGGMKRRLDFALSLVHDPELIILDEPTTGLDPLLIEQFWGIVQKIVKTKGKTVIVTSHILHEVEENCNKVAVMHQGKIAQVIDQSKKKIKLINIFKHIKKFEESKAK